jgi:hypothetical protein
VSAVPRAAEARVIQDIGRLRGRFKDEHLLVHVTASVDVDSGADGTNDQRIDLTAISAEEEKRRLGN